LQIDDVELGLLGRHQAANASVAAALALLLEQKGFRMGEQAIRAGLSDVRWPARFEIARRSPTVVIDAAHNVASIESLLATLDESFSVPRDRRTLIFATSRDKDVRGMLSALAPRFGRMVLTRYTSNPRAADPRELAAIARGPCGPHATRSEVVDDPLAAWELVSRTSEPNDLVCITGSCFIAGELRDRVVHARAAEPSPTTPALRRRA
jgi:dihydrofolate synthase/folylpolyglutamate synthase